MLPIPLFVLKENLFDFVSAFQKMKKQRSLDGEVEKGGKAGTTGSLRSTASSASWVSTESYQSGLSHQSAHTDSNASFVVEVSCNRTAKKITHRLG